MMYPEVFIITNIIHSGGEAMNAFAQMDSMEEAEKAEMREALLRYCALDTLAMMRVLERLKRKN